MTDDESGELPEGWARVSLPEVFHLNPPKPKATDHPDDTPVTFVPMPAVDAVSGTIATPSERPFAKVRKGFTAFRNGDVILAKITPCMENGKAAVARGLMNGIGYGSTEFHVFRSTGAVLPDFLFHFIRQESFRRAAEAEMTGSVGQKRVPAEYLNGVVMPIPPLGEQRRIVTAVEAVLAKVSSARERLERMPTAMKRFRQAVLAAACSGRLTADWRESNKSLEPASKLLERLAASRGTASLGSAQDEDVPPQWTVTTLGFLAEWKANGRPFITSGSRGWAKYVGSTGRHFIRSENINTEYLRLEDAVRVEPPDGAEAIRTQVHPGDLLLTITGNNVGRTAVVPHDCPVAHVSQHVAIIRVEKSVRVEYLWLWLRAEHHGQKHLEHYGETKPGLNLEQIRDVVVSLPPVLEQEEVVRRVAALFALADSFEQRAASALRRVESLTQSVLAKAFRGELVPTEAELARREKRSYETASELLARLAAKPNATAKKKRTRKTKEKAAPSGGGALHLAE